MKLASRLSIFFLVLVAAILAGFSAATYTLAAKYLHQQTDERVEAALNTLVAAAEIGVQGVEWEPEERRLQFGHRNVDGSFHWYVADVTGQRIDGSTPNDNGPDWRQPTRAALGPEQSRRHHRARDRTGGLWHIRVRRLEPATPRTSAMRQAHPERHDALILGAAVSLVEVRASLRNLALLLVGLSVGTLTLAALMGGRIARRAIRPVALMAEAARAISGHEFDNRLPIPAVRDELAELGQAFNDLLDRQRESHERQRRFTGDASHQLRTPLTALQGQVDLALRHERSLEEYQRVLAVVQGKTRHLRGIVEALLFLARADGDSQRPNLEPIALGAWLEDHLAHWTNPRSVDLRLDLDSAVPFWVRAHPALLGELVANLLDNAAKYSRSGTTIEVGVSRDGFEVRLAVTDAGIGIDPETIEVVMTPFYRSPAARSIDSKGLGLGLSVASRIAEVINGRLEATSQVGQGSTFTLVLPAEKPR